MTHYNQYMQDFDAGIGPEAKAYGEGCTLIMGPKFKAETDEAIRLIHAGEAKTLNAAYEIMKKNGWAL